MLFSLPYKISLAIEHFEANRNSSNSHSLRQLSTMNIHLLGRWQNVDNEPNELRVLTLDRRNDEC